MNARNDGDPRRFIVMLAKIGNHVDTALLRSLTEGARRFNEIAADLPAFDEEEIGSGLRELDADGLVARRVDPGPPLRVLYLLTPLGLELAPALRTMADWAQRSTTIHAT
ncbi:MAG: winged helix-turn-helix transcriptional regulator [Candidatus Eremiobacteraeota bacterium]|nr:winged helix-turn-helix transcriptional regulator [Candidatus Eremiobacteraeota bacterium]